MKRGEIECGGEYLFRRGKHGDGRRCVVLDVEQHYLSRRDWPFLTYRADADYLDVKFGAGRWAVYAGRVSSGRLLVAVEVVEYASEFAGGQRVPSGTRWVPYAARAAEIVSPWAAELERRAAAARQLALAEQARIVADKQRAIESERKRAEHEKRVAAMRKEEALRQEQFEQRVEPALRELGFEPRLSGSQITLTLDEATRLAALLGRDVTAES